MLIPGPDGLGLAHDYKAKITHRKRVRARMAASIGPSGVSPLAEDGSVPVPRHYVFALVEDFTHVAFSCSVEPLRLANLVSGRKLYTWSFASVDGNPVRSSNGIVTLVDTSFDNLPDCDQLFVLSGINMQHKETAKLVAALRRERAIGTAIGAICSGSYILAKAGFLDGMQAAIHWEYHDSFAEAFPEVHLQRSVFVAHEKHITASGGTAAADLILHLIDRDHGYDLSVAVADQMVYNVARNASSAQRVSLQSRIGHRNEHLLQAIEIMQRRIEEPVPVSAIARKIGVSTRQVERLFETYLKTSPKKYFMGLRLERAKKLLLQTDSAVSDIAMSCGFTSFSHFSRVYRATFGVSPMMQRARSA